MARDLDPAAADLALHSVVPPAEQTPAWLNKSTVVSSLLWVLLTYVQLSVRLLPTLNPPPVRQVSCSTLPRRREYVQERIKHSKDLIPNFQNKIIEPPIISFSWRCDIQKGM
jgi:hypothetical protein